MQFVQPSSPAESQHGFQRIGTMDKTEDSPTCSSLSQFVAMLVCQLGRVDSLREIERGLKICEGKLTHLTFEAAARTSVSDADTHLHWGLFRHIYSGLHEIVLVRELAPRLGQQWVSLMTQ